MPRLVFVPDARREDVLDRLGAASRQVVTVDDALGRALASEFGREGARNDRQRDERRERSGGQGDRAVEARHLLKPVDDAQHELRPQPERQRPDGVLAIHAPSPVSSAELSRCGSGRPRAIVLSEHGDALNDVDAQGEDRE